MDSRISRGAAAALLSIAVTGSAGAQAAPTRARELRDSVMVRAFTVAKMDTITAIFRAIDHEQYGSPAWVELTHRLDSLMMAGPNRVIFRTDAATGALPRIRMMMPRGWIGFNAQGPMQKFMDEDGERVTYFAYPSILSVDAGSPADKAGIVPGDMLIAFNGTDVVGNEFNITKLFAPDKKVAVTVRRDGDTRDYSLNVVRAPEPIAMRRQEFSRVGAPLPPGAVGVIRVDVDKSEHPEPPSRPPTARMTVNARGGVLMAGRYNVITPHGVWGASASPVGDDLAKVLKLEKGVLINEVPEESPAFKSGLRAGDVIVSASGQAVSTLSQLQDQILSRLGDRKITLNIMRNHKASLINVTW